MLNLNQYLHLTRPLFAFDVETTGIDTDKDRIIQIGIEIHFPDKEPTAYKSYVDPECDIPENKHGINSGMMLLCNNCQLREDQHPTDTCPVFKKIPKFREFGHRLLKHTEDVDILGYNVDHFDIRILRAEFKRMGIDWQWNGFVVDPLPLWRQLEPHTLERFFERFTGKKLEGAHDADNDIKATIEGFVGLLSAFPELPHTVEELYKLGFPKRSNAVDREGKIIWNADGEACIAFGKYANTPLKTLAATNKGYFTWMMKGDFSADVKGIIQAALMGTFPSRPESNTCISSDAV